MPFLMSVLRQGTDGACLQAHPLRDVAGAMLTAAYLRHGEEEITLTLCESIEPDTKETVIQLTDRLGSRHRAQKD